MHSRHHFRPRTARAVAGRADSLAQFGLNLRDWFHELRNLSTRAGLLAAVSHRPPRLRHKIADGDLADAFLAAQVEHLCHHAGLPPPRWTQSPEYILEKPWFASPDAPASLRALLIRDADVAFKNRNLFTTSEITWQPKRGRPRKSLAAQRETNRLRQRRWREAQKSLKAAV